MSQQSVSVKVQIVNIFGFADRTVFVQLLSFAVACRLRAAVDNRYTNAVVVFIATLLLDGR